VALEKVRDRIAELSKPRVREESKGDEEGKEGGVEDENGDTIAELQSLKLTEKALVEHERRLGGVEEEKSNNKDDGKSLASMLSEAKSLRSIHSARSLKAVINKMNTPVIVKIDEEGGARLNKRNDPSQLPYMHRNPAV
jgi:hypothetical protein